MVRWRWKQSKDVSDQQREKHLQYIENMSKGEWSDKWIIVET